MSNWDRSRLRECRSAAAFFANGVGDGVLVLPALRGLIHEFQGDVRLVLKNGVDRFLFEALGAHKCLFLDMRMTQELDGREFPHEAATSFLQGSDVFLSFAEWRSDSLTKARSGAGSRFNFGFFPEFDAFPSPESAIHQFDKMFSITQLLFPGLTIEAFSQRPPFSTRIRGAGQEILGGLDNRLLIGLHPESSDKTKCYPFQRLEDLVIATTNIDDDIVLCVFGQHQRLSELERVSDRVVVFNYLPLELVAYLVSCMHVFVGVDSCFLHFADLGGVRGVGLFSPTSSTRWGFRFARHIHIENKLGMDYIEPSQVADAVAAMLQES